MTSSVAQRHQANRRKSRCRSPAPNRSQNKGRDMEELVAIEFLSDGAVRKRYCSVHGPRVLSTRPSSSACNVRSLASRLMVELSSIFLPNGYPNSVRQEYLRFQFFDTLQAACSYLRNILTTAAILRGAGVGESTASPLAAAIAWVLRDGLGMLGSLLFSYAVGGGFDRNVKEWRLFADLINDVGLTLDMLAPLAGGGTSFTMVAALGAACKTVCGMTAGATRASITAHFALRGNLADVSAKEGAQETAVTLIGLLLGSTLAQSLGDSQLTCWMAFIVLTAVHVWANWMGVGSLALVTLNRQRSRILCDTWWVNAQCDTDHVDRSRLHFAPEVIAVKERPWGPLLMWLRGPHLACPLSELEAWQAQDGGIASLKELAKIFEGENYALRATCAVTLDPNATGETLLRSIFHCALIQSQRFAAKASRAVSASASTGCLGPCEAVLLRETLEVVRNEWPHFAKVLSSAGWELSRGEGHGSDREPALRLDTVGGIRVRLFGGKRR